MLKYTLTARPEPSGAHEAVEGGTGHARDLGDGGLGNAQLEETSDFVVTITAAFTAPGDPLPESGRCAAAPASACPAVAPVSCAEEARPAQSPPALSAGVLPASALPHGSFPPRTRTPVESLQIVSTLDLLVTRPLRSNSKLETDSPGQLSGVGQLRVAKSPRVLRCNERGRTARNHHHSRLGCRKAKEAQVLCSAPIGVQVAALPC